MKKYFLISFIFLISYINSLNIQSFLESFASTLLGQETKFEGCFDENFTNGLNIINIALNEKNKKKFILGFSTTIIGLRHCMNHSGNLITIATEVGETIRSINIGEIDFNILKNLLCYLIDSFFEESGNSVTYGEAFAETILKLKDF